MRLRLWTILASLPLVTMAACNSDGLAGGGDKTPDAAVMLDQSVPLPPDLSTPVDLWVDVCSPGAGTTVHFGPPDDPFVLEGDVGVPGPLVRDNGVARDKNGYLVIARRPSGFNNLWVPNSSDLGGDGTVSKVDTKTVREVARYPSVTCYSNKLGSRLNCDGTRGCCTIDDWQRYEARKTKKNQPPHQAVQTTGSAPVRAVVDYVGDVFVANEALGTQSSVTKIANDPAVCIDRNANGVIDTSKDTNGDGFIETDCNGDGKPDEIDSVQAKPCTNKLPQEYFGLDDECVLWTSNVFDTNGRARALALGSGSSGSSFGDAWVGSYTAGKVYRLDGTTGLGAADLSLGGGCAPFGLEIDASGVGWVATNGQGKLCYFDTQKAVNVGVVRDPQWGPANGYGITLDRDQNVWLGGDVARYTPDRSNGFNNLGTGWWTRIANTPGLGIRSDSRSANAYFVFSCKADQTGALEIPASTLKLVKMDQVITPMGWPTITMPCRGVTIDSDQNVWGIDATTSTRALVNKLGNIIQPTVKGAPMGNNVCPAGDSCPNQGGVVLTQSTGFGLAINGSRPTPQYNVLIPGCTDSQGSPQPTEWGLLSWDADVPANTALSITVASGDSGSWSAPSWSGARSVDVPATSPVCLRDILVPNRSTPGAGEVADAFLQIDFFFKTQSQQASPTLKAFEVTYRCK